MYFQIAFNGSFNSTYIDAIDELVQLQPQSRWGVAVFILAALTATTYRILSTLFPVVESQEPFGIPQKIPFFGHLLGLITSGVTYYLDLSSRWSLPIYSLQILQAKIYVVNSPELVSIIQRNSKTLSPYPFLLAFLKPLLGFDDASIAAIRHNMSLRESYIHEVHSMHQQTMSPGAAMNQMQNRAMNELAKLLNQVNGSTSTNIYSWTQEVFIKFNTTALWGSENPFQRDPSCMDAFWNIEAQFHKLILNFFPNWTAGGAAQDREKLVGRFADYHKTADLNDACELVQQCIGIGKKYGLSDDAVARMDLGLAQALLANTVPIALWMLLEVFSNAALLAELRVEVERLLINNDSDFSQNGGLVDFTRLKEQCPLLSSTWHEVLRVNSFLPSGRAVLEDTMVQGQYLLKKGATALIFAGVLHSDTNIWGADAAQFNPRRFLKGETQPKVHPAAFRPFGGGNVLCPGRTFAFNVVLTFVATLILGYDIRPETGVWPKLERDVYRPSLGVYKPKKQCIPKVTISRRPGFENCVWEYPLQPET